MDISIVILTWNSDKYFSRCLNALVDDLDQSGLSHEIFIVDNGSTDGTVAIIKSYQSRYPEQISPIFLDNNKGTTYTRNIALRKAQGKYISILDSDIEILHTGTMKNLIETLESDTNLGLVAPKLLYADGRLQKSTDRFPTIFSKIFRYFFLKIIEKNESNFEDRSETRAVDYAISAMWVLKKEVLEKVGYLDENIYYAPEDVDYCLRLWLSGYSVVYDTRVSAIHHAQEISRGFKLNKAIISHIRGLFYYFWKYQYLFRPPVSCEKKSSKSCQSCPKPIRNKSIHLNKLKKTRVLMLLSNAFNPDPRVHREATALVENGYSVTILCWDRDLNEKPNEEIDGITVQRVFVRSTHGRGASQIFFLFIFWLKASLKAVRQPVDTVHAHDFDTLPLGYVISKLKGAKLVYDAHESYIDMLLNVPYLMKRMIFHAENWFMRQSDLVITVGDILREYLVGRGAKKASVVGNWQDPGKFEFSTTEKKKEKKRLGIYKDQLVIVFIAHLGTERQLPQLIEAVRQIPSVFLLIGGNGPCRQLAEDAAERCDNITYLGFVQPATIPFYTALSDMVFYGFDPSVPNAMFSAPNKLFEGLAAGKAILTGNFGEIEKIVRENSCGMIIDEYSIETITAAITDVDTDSIRNFGENAKKAGLNRYNWELAKQELLEQYESLWI